MSTKYTKQDVSRDVAVLARVTEIDACDADYAGLDEDDEGSDEPGGDEETTKPHSYTPQIVCPYCGHAHRDSWEYFSGSGDDARIECSSCSREFDCERDIEITYSTNVIDRVAEAAGKAREEQQILERYAACQVFVPGMRVCVKRGRYDNGSQVGRVGSVANKELCRRNPFVHVDLDPPDGEEPRRHCEIFFPDQLERI